MFYNEIKAKFNSELKKAMKENNVPIKSVISILSSRVSLLNKELTMKNKEFTESDLISICSSELKQTKESLLEAERFGRIETAEELKIQIKFIESFLPAQLSKEEVLEVITNTIKSLNIEEPTKKDMGIIMQTVNPILKGKADGKLISELVRSFLK